MLADFRRRVLLYSAWDGRLARHTRFFAAAAVTNGALAELFGLCSARSFVSCSTASFLSEAGTALEQLNLEVAGQITFRPYLAADFDAYMIHSEQSAVELLLRELKRSDSATHQQVINQINRLLERVRTGFNLARLFPHGAYYAEVLRAAYCKLGHPTDFAVQNERELVGHTLIVRLRDRQDAQLPAERRRQNRTC
jgi:hypothetical protein